MKYYIYISDAKIEMLLPQIQKEVRKKTSTEFKIDLKVLSASRKTEADAGESRISRLEAISQYILENRDVGTAENPGEYIFDIMDMQYGFFQSVVFFGGRSNHSIVTLGGSRKHMIGEMPKQVSTVPYGDPAWSFCLELFLTEFPFDKTSSDSEVLSSLPLKIIERDTYTKRADVKYESLAAAKYVVRSLRTPRRSMEFLAKVLSIEPNQDFYWPSRHTRVLLASPLYVALSDEKVLYHEECVLYHPEQFAGLDADIRPSFYDVDTPESEIPEADLQFLPHGEPVQRGLIRPGGRIVIKYCPSRIYEWPPNYGQDYGFDSEHIAYVHFLPGEQFYEIPFIKTIAGFPDWCSMPNERDWGLWLKPIYTIVPMDATQVQLWFMHKIDNNKIWDSRFGLNYSYDIIP